MQGAHREVGLLDSDAKDAILDALIADAETQEAFGEDFDPDELPVVRAVYDPIAERLAELRGHLYRCDMRKSQ